MKVRIVVGIIGLDQHEVGAIAIARLLTLHGFEVIYLGRFQTPQSMIAAAVDEGAQVVGARGETEDVVREEVFDRLARWVATRLESKW